MSRCSLENLWMDRPCRHPPCKKMCLLSRVHQPPAQGTVSGDNLFSAPKTSRSLSNSNLRYLRHSSDSNCLQVPETLWNTSYSEPLPAIPNTTARSLHSDPLSDTPSRDYSETSTSSKGSSETSLDSVPSDPNSAPTFLRDSPSHSRDKAAPAAFNIKGCVVKVIHNIKGRGWSGSVGNAGR